jgi:hypothetical protein
VLGGIIQGYLWHIHGEVLDGVGLAAGVVACLALGWRRAHPLAVFVLVFAAALISPLAQFAALAAVCTAASRMRGRALIAVVVMAAAATSCSRSLTRRSARSSRSGSPPSGPSGWKRTSALYSSAVNGDLISAHLE